MAEPEWLAGSAVLAQLTFAEFEDTNKILKTWHGWCAFSLALDVMTANHVEESTREALNLEGKLMSTVASYVLFKLVNCDQKMIRTGYFPKKIEF